MMPRKIDDLNAATIQQYKENPVYFSENILHVKPWEKQKQILNAVRDYPRVSVRSSNGIGKSNVAAQVIMWFLYTHKNSIVLNTAPTWRQVEKLIWKEIRINHQRAGILGGTLAPKSPELQIDQDRWYASGISTNQPDRFQGWHAKDILVVVDEAAGVNEEIFDAISGVLTSENAKMLMLGNPTSVGGTFYKSFSSGEYKTFHISAWMTPNFTHFKITRQDIIDGTWKDKMGDELAPYPWLIQPKWVASQYKMWGLDHPAWQARIEGNFPSVGEHTLLPLDWIEAARNRGLDKDAKS